MSLHALVEKWRRKEVENGEAGDEWEAAIYRECADELAAALAGGGEAVAWASDTPYGRGYSFAQELLDFLETNPAGAVQVRVSDSIADIVAGISRLASVISQYGTCPPAALDELADRLDSLRKVPEEGARTVRLDLSVFDQPGDPRSNLIARGWMPPEASRATSTNAYPHWGDLPDDFDDEATPEQALGDVMTAQQELEILIAEMTARVPVEMDWDQAIGVREEMFVRCFIFIATHGQHFAGLAEANERLREDLSAQCLATSQQSQAVLEHVAYGEKQWHRAEAAEARCAELESLPLLPVKEIEWEDEYKFVIHFDKPAGCGWLNIDDAGSYRLVSAAFLAAKGERHE